MNESRHIWMSHVTCEWVMSREDASRHISMGHVTYMDESKVSESRLPWATAARFQRATYESCYTYEQVMFHMNESRHVWTSHVTYGRVTSHMNAPSQTNTNESCLPSTTAARLQRATYERVMSHVWTSHVPYKWVTSHINESRHIWMSHVTYGRVVSNVNAPCQIRMSHVFHRQRQRDSSVPHMNQSCHT